MSLNTRIAVASLLALLTMPLWLPLLPFAVWWLRQQSRLGKAAGFACLPRCLADTLAACAAATQATAPPGGWQRVARNVDQYLAAVRSPRHWRTFAMLLLLEFSPCLRLRRPLSRMAPADCRRWIDARLSTTRGLLAVPALARQLVRMGYYADREVAAALSFRRMRERARVARIGQGAAPPARPAARVAG
jgi:hypothetical protein